MNNAKHETIIKDIKETVDELKRDKVRLNEIIDLLEEIIEDSTPENFNDYVPMVDEIEDSFEVIEFK